VDGQRVEVKTATALTRVLLYHKTAGEICSYKDPLNRTTIFKGLPNLQHSKWMSVGRLDIATTGLLLISNDGDLVHLLMHPSSAIDRTYLCRVRGNVSNSALIQLKTGVTSNNDLLKFKEIERLNQQKGINCWFRITLSQGKNREIHRAWGSVGHQVSRLKRIQYGPMKLPADLKPGKWRELDAAGINQLKLIGVSSKSKTS